MDLYLILNNGTIILTVNSFLIEQNLIQIKFLENCHFTICFKRGISLFANRIRIIINDILSSFQQVNTSIENQCVVCCDRKYNQMCKPCNHICMCSQCSINIRICPICRSRIVSKEEIFLS